MTCKIRRKSKLFILFQALMRKEKARINQKLKLIMID